MANLAETPTYDAGVYQLETTDPVQGGASGVSNTPLKNLANRTAYLKQRIDNIESGTTDLPGYAKLASPAFTGSPTAPTQALGDNSTKIANTAFVQGTVGGRLSKSVAGGVNVTLTAVEAGNAILELTGAITANIAVIVPTSPTRSWIVKNATSGAFTLTIKTAAGTGVVVTQGTNAIVWTDGTNVLDALTDFDSPVLTGNPVAPTPAQFDNDTSLATTEFVQRALGNMSGITDYTDTATIPASKVGGVLTFASATAKTFTLPAPNAVPAGSKLTIQNYSSNASTGTLTLTTPSGVIGGQLAAAASQVLGIGCQVELISNGNNAWLAYNGSGTSFLTQNGYQKLPSGMILQWGVVAISAGATATVTLPIAVNNLWSTSVVANSSGTLYGTVLNYTTTNFQIKNQGGATANFFWIAVCS